MLVCHGLRKQFGGRTAVDDVTFSIAEGECYGLLGPNGAGKTTTIAMVCGLLESDSGSATIDGAPAGSLKAKAAVGFVPQELALYPDLTAVENLHFFGQLYGVNGQRLKRRIGETLELVGLTERANERIGTYSGGMKRRANIAAGLLHEPKLLILDEPTVGVDPQSRNAILETVANLGIAVLYTTHYMEEAAKLCRRVGIINSGRLIAEATPDQLISQHGGQDRVRLNCAATEVERLAEACRGLDGVSKVELMEGGLELRTDHGATMLARVVHSASDLHVPLTGVEVIAPNLESVFLALTGKELRD